MERGSFITIHLIDPIERHWGRLIHIMNAGVTFRGIPINEIEAFKYQLGKEDQRVFPQTVFIPMRRVQKVDLDEPVGSTPAVIESMMDKRGLDEDQIIGI